MMHIKAPGYLSVGNSCHFIDALSRELTWSRASARPISSGAKTVKLQSHEEDLCSRH